MLNLLKNLILCKVNTLIITYIYNNCPSLLFLSYQDKYTHPDLNLIKIKITVIKPKVKNKK